MVRRTNRPIKHRIFWGVAGLILLIWLYQYGFSPNAPLPPADMLFEDGIMRVGLDPTRPPFAFFDENGNYIGLEIELAYAISKVLKADVQLIPLGFDGLYDAMKTNRVDMVIAGLQPTVHTDGNSAIYTRHYFDAGLVLVSQHHDVEGMKSLSGLSLAYEFGSEADALAHRWRRRIPPFELRPYELPRYALAALEVNQADAVLTDALNARLYNQQNPTLNVKIIPITHQWFSIAVPQTDLTLHKTLNRALQTLDENGTLDAIIDNWL